MFEIEEKFADERVKTFVYGVRFDEVNYGYPATLFLIYNDNLKEWQWVEAYKYKPAKTGCGKKIKIKEL